jgi:hypothetical protein
LAVNCPALTPSAAGVKVTGTVIDSPAESDAGSERLGAPIVNAEPASTKDVTVVGADAVNVAVELTD